MKMKRCHKPLTPKQNQGLRPCSICEPLEGRTLLAIPVVVSASPLNQDIGVGISAKVSAKFNGGMNAASFTASTFRLTDPNQSALPGRLSYNSVSNAVALDVSAPLQYSTTYTATIVGGSSGVKSSAQEAMPSNHTWTFKTAASPQQGPGGPILVISGSANPFSSYYPEILRAEGLNAFSTMDISGMSSTSIAGYRQIILGQVALTNAQVTTLGNWVNNGGDLIAMRPDKRLASLLGLGDAGLTMANGYMLVDRAQPAAAGITDQTMQYHGTADNYTLNGANPIATLYSSATAATSYPAVTIRGVGGNGGQAAAFTYDLARSIVYTRQGNPAWSGQNRDGLGPIRSDDLFYGSASFDPQPDWVNLNKVQIPQADEQQRLLANMLTVMSQDSVPLPRFWYLPNGAKAAVVMSGDDHANGGTASRFNSYKAAAPTSNAVPSWSSVRSTSYMYPGSISDAQAAPFFADGFEPALHVTTNLADYTSYANLDQYYTTQLAQFQSTYPSLPTPETSRTHAIVWSDYATQPKVELAHRIRMDTNYYFWPPAWVQDRPGLFTGSAMPMRFADTNGSMIDVYQTTTQMTDESGQSYPYTINTLLDNALGPPGYYGVFTANMHTDAGTSAGSDAIIASARGRNVPVITAQQLLRWVDGRNSSSFGSLAWSSSTSTLSFTITAGFGANGLQTMVPLRSRGMKLAEIRSVGTPIAFTTQVIKGIEYAFFTYTPSAPGAADGFTARYAVDNAPPIITNVVALPTNSGVAVVTWNTDKLSDSRVEYGTLAGSLSLSASAPTMTVSHGVTLTGLAANATYYYRVVSTDSAGNQTRQPAAAQSPASFTMPALLASIWDSSAVPQVITTADSNPVELGMKFRSDVSGVVSGVRFYKGPQNTGTHLGSLWSSTGQLLATATFTNETASGWQQVGFANPVAINPNTTYIVSYFAPFGSYSNTPNGLSFSIDRAPLHALASATDGGNGVYRYGAGSGFPSSTYNATNYWVDVVLNPNGGSTSGPTVVSQTPAFGSSAVPVNTTVSATFNQSVQPATISFVLKTQAGQVVNGSVSYDGTTRTARLTPAAALAGSTTYTATLGGATDVQGNVMTPVSWSFTTAVTSSGPVSIWDASSTPTQASANDPNPVEVGVKFRSDVAGLITGIRFYKGAANTGTHTGNLWSGTGQNLASATFTNETASGWQAVTFASPVAINANTTTVASYFAPVGRYAADLNGLAAAIDRAPLHALASGTDGGNGVYRYGVSSGFPSSTYNASNYWVDVIFTPTITNDIQPPTVAGNTPASGLTAVATDTTVTATFSEAVQASTISFILRDPSNNAIPAVVTSDAATNTATLTPTSALANGTIFTATVSGAQDSAGNAMTSPVSWSFTTVDAVTARDPFTIWSPSATPAATSQVTSSAELGLKFRSDVDGIIRGVRFHKDLANTGVHVANLWTRTGQKLATATFTNETASGWQQALFSSPVAIKADTTYVVSYFAPTGRYSITVSGLVSRVDNPPLRALASGGVYIYNPSSAFPTTTYRSTNYWVDVVFDERTAPTIVSRSPAPAATGVSRAAKVKVTFSEAIDPATINTGTFILRQGANAVAATITYDAATSTATLSPVSSLQAGTAYTVLVKGGDTGVKDLIGNPLAVDAAWTFTTA